MAAAEISVFDTEEFEDLVNQRDLRIFEDV